VQLNIKGYTWQKALGKGLKMHGFGKSFSDYVIRGILLRFTGMRLVFFDEISMYRLCHIWEISERIKAGLLAQTSDPVAIARIMFLPFGGLHVIYTGDLYQLPPVCGENMSVADCHFEVGTENHAGKEIWQKLKEYFELTTTPRFESATDSIFPEFLKGARIGQVNHRSLAYINAHCLCKTQEEAVLKAHTKAIWLTPTNKRVKEINDGNFAKLVANGATHFRIMSHHIYAAGTLKHTGEKDQSVLEKLLKYTPTSVIKFPPAYLDFAVGTRVRCTQNIAPAMGLYAGAMGTIFGFAFTSAVPPPSGHKNLVLAAAAYTEIPITFVQMDEDNGYTIFEGIPGFIPFAAYIDTHRFHEHYVRRQLPL
jgi:hypothetical protein